MLHLACPLLWSDPQFYTHVIQEEQTGKTGSDQRRCLLKLESKTEGKDGPSVELRCPGEWESTRKRKKVVAWHTANCTLE